MTQAHELNPELLTQLAAHYRSQGGLEWLRQMRQRTGYTPGAFGLARENAQQGVHYVPDIAYSAARNSLGITQQGGFFYPITPENLEVSVRRLFADHPDRGDWLLQHIRSGERKKVMERLQELFTRTPALTPQQTAFLEGYDRMISRLFSANPRESSFNFYLFTYISQDGTLTDREMMVVLSQGQFTELMQRMGPLASDFVVLTGGVVQGIIDLEPSDYITGRRYDAETEVIPMVPAGAVVAIRASNATNRTVLPISTSAVVNAAQFMEGACGTRQGYVFSASQARAAR